MKQFWNKRFLLVLLKLGIALAVMCVLIKKVDIQHITSAFRSPREPLYIILAVFLLIPNLWIQWYRWHYLLRLLQKDVRISESASSLFGGMVIGFATPGRVGELGRSLFLRQIDKLGALGLVFIDKLYSLMVICIGGIWGLFSYFATISDRAAFVMWPLLFVALVLTILGIALLLHPEWVRTLLYQFTLLLPYRDKMKRLMDCMDRFRGNHARFFLLLSFSLYGIFIGQFILFAFAFQNMSLMTALTATINTLFVKTLLPISFADLGIRETAAVFFFLQYGAQEVTAFNSSILLFTVNVLLPSLFGLLFLPRLGRKPT